MCNFVGQIGQNDINNGRKTNSTRIERPHRSIRVDGAALVAYRNSLLHPHKKRGERALAGHAERRTAATEEKD